MADTKRRIKNEEIKKETTEPEAVSQSTAMQERMESVSRKILITARNELYMKMRFLDVALSCMPFIPDTGADGMGTDGLYLYYDPQYLGGLFREDRVMVNRIYLHLVLHGIFRHMLRRKGREERIYHLACDIVAESIIDGLQYRCVMKGRSLPRREMYRMLKKKMKTLTAERVYEVLKKEEFPETKLGQLESDFRVDDHSYWPKDEDKKKQKEKKKDSKLVSYEMFCQGMTIEEIAKTRDLVTGTIAAHLEHYLREDKIKLEQVVTADKIKKVRTYLETHEFMGVVAIKAALGDEVSYADIRFVLATAGH